MTHNVHPLIQSPDPFLAPSLRLPRTLPGPYKTLLIHSPNTNCSLLHHSNTILSAGLQPQPGRVRSAPDWSAAAIVGFERTLATTRPRPEEERQGQSRRESWIMGVLQSGEDGTEYAGGR